VQAYLQAESVAISPEAHSQLRSVALTIHQTSAPVPGKVDLVSLEVSESRSKSEPIMLVQPKGSTGAVTDLLDGLRSERNESLHECYLPREACALLGYR
jgi:hypothetical protein